MKRPLLHIVRRYGPVGGMERYAWEVSGELSAMGHKVEVLCEHLHADAPPSGIRCIELGEVAAKPRWLAHLRFSRRVSQWLANNPEPRRIIHSHERTAVHHVSTFHGPPFATVFERPWSRRASLRAQANLWLERREVCGSQVRAVVPNAGSIAAMLKRFYPCIGERLSKPVTPGVTPGPGRPRRAIPTDGGVIGFVGKEWKRKGLDIATGIVHALRQKCPDIELWVAGPAKDDVRHLFSDWNGGYRLLGEVDSRDIYPQLDLLLHPARAEPYGMIIAEAMAARVPVLVSSQCGAASEVSQAHGAVLELYAPADAWADAAHVLLAKENSSPGFTRPWRQVAQDYVAIYERIANDIF
ncbi:MAG: glycosyltransferase family 4 protein [Mariprofundaceae bacterium]